jgi:hypothetical protein
MNPQKKPVTAAATPAVSKVPAERQNFKALLLSNPNYFGNLVKSPFKPVKKIVAHTQYEELTCVGYNLPLRLLEATVQIKLPGGYGGGLCFAGSTEYVRFYVNYGSGWEDVGLASFNAHDIPNFKDCAGQPDKPLSYVATLELDPKRDWCGHPVLPAVRAILSWNLAPPSGNPGWTPIWGNVRNDHIQIAPRKWFFGDFVASLGDLIKKAEVPPLIEEAYPQPIPLPDPPPLALAELVKAYGGGKKAREQAVQPHRFAYEHVQSAMADVSQSALVSMAAEFKGLGLDLDAIVKALNDTKANVGFEELECLGLDYDWERLVATFRVKRPTGYSGDLCHKGSLEHVAFWADWNNECEWTYLGTVDVNVHDIATIPAGGLSYSAILPVDLNALRQPCSKPKIARVRAVLSWSTPPSTVDPDALTTWGNRIDAHVQIKPGLPIELGPKISIIGGIGVDNIGVFVDGLTKTSDTYGLPGVPFAMYGWAYADEWAPHTRKCPFGGTIVVQGPPPPPPFNPTYYKYRLWARNTVTNATVIVKDPYFTTDLNGVGTWRYPDPITGYSSYLGQLQNMNAVLSYWAPGGDDLWEIRLELANSFDVPLGITPPHLVQLDNTGPVRKPKGEAPLAGDTMDIYITSGGGDCATFMIGDPISGRFVARDLNLGEYSLMTTPVSLGPPSPVPSFGLVQTAPAVPAPGGNGWTLDTAGMEACGYVIVVQVWDRSIVNSYPGSHNYNWTDVGFCLREP